MGTCSSNENATRVVEKLDTVLDRLTKIDVTLAAQHQSLVDHIRRTELLEDAIEPLKASVLAVKWLMGLLAILAALAEILGFFKH